MQQLCYHLPIFFFLLSVIHINIKRSHTIPDSQKIWNSWRILIYPKTPLLFLWCQTTLLLYNSIDANHTHIVVQTSPLLDSASTFQSQRLQSILQSLESNTFQFLQQINYERKLYAALLATLADLNSFKFTDSVLVMSASFTKIHGN